MSSTIDSIAKSGVEGMHKNMAKAAEHAETISNSFHPSGGSSFDETLDALIGLKLAAYGVKANAKVVNVSDELNKSLLAIA